MRAFILGAGISLGEHLRRGHLDALSREVTFAMNKIHLIYDLEIETDWQPTHYVFFENNSSKGSDGYQEYVPFWIKRGVNCIIGEPYRMGLAKVLNVSPIEYNEYKITWMSRARCHFGNHLSPDPPDEWHLPQLCGFGGTMNVTIQLAFMMGYDPIYLIACDLGFVLEDDLDEAPNHFHPDYWTGDDWPLQLRDPTLIHMHQTVRRSVERMDRSIFNAGIGGELDVYDRIPIEDLL